MRRQNVAGKYYLLNANDVSVGRLASKAASLLRGKASVDFMPDMGGKDVVIVINAGKIKLTGKKSEQKTYYKYSGYPSGMTRTSFKKMLQEKPFDVLKKAVYCMLPPNRLRMPAMKRLKLFLEDSHPYKSEQIKQVEI